MIHLGLNKVYYWSIVASCNSTFVSEALPLQGVNFSNEFILICMKCNFPMLPNIDIRYQTVWIFSKLFLEKVMHSISEFIVKYPSSIEFCSAIWGKISINTCEDNLYYHINIDFLTHSDALIEKSVILIINLLVDVL